MFKKAILLLLIFLFAFISSGFAEPQKKFTEKDIRQFMTNSAFNFIDKDTNSSLYLLDVLKQGKTDLAAELLEFQLDIIVCECWDMKDKLNEPSNVHAVKLLRMIKAYRQENPRVHKVTLTQEQIQAMFPLNILKDIDYTEQANLILTGLE